MRDLQIQMLYEQYGWKPEQIGNFLAMSPATVRLIIEQHGFSQSQVTVTTEATQLGIEELRGVEVSKQKQLTPIITTIELSLLQKTMDMIPNCDCPNDLANLIKAFKTLTQDSIINTVVREEKSNGKGPAIAVQIINEVN